MLHSGLRRPLPAGGAVVRRTDPLPPRPQHPHTSHIPSPATLLRPQHAHQVPKNRTRGTPTASALASDVSTDAHYSGDRSGGDTATATATRSSSTLRLTAEAEAESAAPLATCRVVVPYHATRPGQQLFLVGCTPGLGGWDEARAVPLQWREGHQHEAVVRLPTSRVVQAKLLLKEEGVTTFTELGEPRDIMLMPTASSSPYDNYVNGRNAGNTRGQAQKHPQQQKMKATDGQTAPPAETVTDAVVVRPQPQQGAPSSVSTSAATHGSAGPSSTTNSAVDYVIICHFGHTEATQILRLPIVMPARQPGDRRVLCKIVVLLGGQRLEPRHFPALVGSAAELGAWRAEAGVRLMRQVGGYWTRRVELSLEGEVQAKVVICNPDGQAALWEPGASNRILAAPPLRHSNPDLHNSSSSSHNVNANDGANHTTTNSMHASAAAASPMHLLQQQPRQPGQQDMMHVFVCRWGHTGPGCTAVVSIPVEYEDASQEYVRQLDAAQREIGLMRQAVTAKSRRCQALDSELTASRRAERALREEVAALKGGLGELAQELETAQLAELAARQEAEELGRELVRQREEYERQVSWLEAKLDEMEQDLLVWQALHEEQRQQQQQQQQSYYYPQDSNSNGGYHSSSDNVSYEQDSPPRVMTRSKWR